MFSLVIETETMKSRTAAQTLILLFAVLFSGCVAIPTKNEPAAYTQAIVQDAIRLFSQEGRQAAIDHYSSAENVDGEWYAFIIGEDGYTIAHFNPRIRGRDPALRVDSTGYFFGDEMLSATEEGKWISYVTVNPDTGEEARKHTWIVRHGGHLFASGWYEKE